MSSKGTRLEEEARAYLAQQGYFAIRSVSLLFEGAEVTDLDVWAYGRHGAGTRVRAIVDAKSKRSPKALERIVWAKGMQASLKLDHVFVATTEQDSRVADFARDQGVKLLPKAFLEKSVSGQEVRLSLEELQGSLGQADVARSEDWIKVIDSARSALVSLGGFQAFNKCAAAFRFFVQRLMVDPQVASKAVRCAQLMASYAAICLDMELSKYAFEPSERRFAAVAAGIRFGDSNGSRVGGAMRSLLSVIADRMPNGKAVAAQAGAALDQAFSSVRSEVVAEFFAKEGNQVNLVRVARELEQQAHSVNVESLGLYTTEQKQYLGVLLDFLELPRPVLLSSSSRISESKQGVMEVDQGSKEQAPAPVPPEATGKPAARKRGKRQAKRPPDSPQDELI